MRSEVNSYACVTSNCVLTANEKSQPVTSCIFIVSSESHTCPGTDLWPHTYALWPHRMMSNPQINFKAVLIFIELAQLHFCLAYQNCHWAFIDCHAPVILQLWEDKILIYPIKIEFWSNTSYFLIKSHFLDCSLLFDTPGIYLLSWAYILVSRSISHVLTQLTPVYLTTIVYLKWQEKKKSTPVFCNVLLSKVCVNQY